MEFNPDDFMPDAKDLFDPTKEPSEAMRTAIREMRLLFVAMVREGFTEAQALNLISSMLKGAMGNG